MAAEVNAVANVIHSAGMLTLQIGSGWYKASAATDLFRLRLAFLEEQSNYWISLLKNCGRNEEPSIRKVLEEASKLLAQEEAKFNQMQSSCSCVRMGKKLLFPDSVTASIEGIISAFDMITKQVEKATTLSQVARLPFKEDPKFVEFKTTITKVRTALESETTGSVVTIFGGPGQGKTSMARHLALLYQNTSSVVNPPETVLDNDLTGMDMTSKRFKDGVFFLSCGPNVDSKDLLVNLWQDLGSPLLPSTVEADYQDQATSSNATQHSMQSESILYRELTKRLSSQKVLIVLDDVCEPLLLQKVIVQGNWIKYLITTRQSKLYGDASCVQISITTPTSEEACQILRNHVWEFPKDITRSLQAAMDAIVEKSAHNPLVLANIATNIRHERADDLEEWKSTERYLEDLIQDVDVKVFPILFGRTYSKGTMRASTTMALNSFSNEEQTLLLLASICESQPIPEVVFKILFKKIHVSLARFSRGSEQLQCNNFIQIDSMRTPNGVPKRSWSIHPMRQSLIGVIKDEEVSLLFARLLEHSAPDDIVLALLVLYGQVPWRDKAADKMEIPKKQFQNSFLDSTSFHWNHIRPFVWLLHVDGEEKWERKAFQLANKILYNYLLFGNLHDGYVSILLARQETLSLTCEALRNFITPHHKPLTCFSKTIHVLVNYLQLSTTKESSNIILATSMISILCFQSFPMRKEIGSVPGAIDKLVALLAKGENLQSQGYAAFALANIAVDMVDNKIKIGSIPGAIEKLVALLAKDQNPQLQGDASFAIATIASNMADNQLKSGLIPDSIEKLVAILAKDENPQLQMFAALALASVTAHMVDNQLKIGLIPGAIDKLVALLAKDDNQELQGSAAFALASIAVNMVDNQVKIGLIPDAIEKLVALLAKNENPKSQKHAALALGNIATDMVDNQVKIGLILDAIKKLVALLAKDENPQLQMSASIALGNIVANIVNNQVKIGLIPGAINKLVALLAKDENPKLQESAAFALASTVVNMVDNQVKIGLIPDAIEKLVALLAKDENPELQESAAFALAHIVANIVDNQVKIGLIPGAIEKLVALLAKDENPKSQEHAALALGNIATNMVDNQIKIGLIPDAIEKLVALLAKDENPKSQEHAALALGNVVANMVDNQGRIGLIPGAINKLVALLAKNENPKSQEHAALALGNIAANMVDNQVRIGLIPNAIDKLVALLAKVENPRLQESAAFALGNIAANMVANQVKIGLIPGAINKLVKILGKAKNPKLQGSAAFALASIAVNMVDNQVKIGLIPGAINKLVEILGKAKNPKLQGSAAFALASIAANMVPNQIKIGLIPGAINKLVEILGKAENPKLQGSATFALASIAINMVDNQVKIGLIPGAIEKLVALLAKDENPKSQEHAALALGNIAANMVDNQIRIGLIPGAIDKLVALLAHDENPNVQKNAAAVLAIIEAKLENKVRIGLSPAMKKVQALLVE